MISVTRSFLLGVLAVALSIPAAAQVRLQVIHNAADPGAAVVDIYINGTLELDNVAFRSATGFLDLPSDTDLAIAVAPGSSTDVSQALATQTFNLPSGTYQLIANGVLAPGDFEANPDAVDIEFALLPGLNAQEEATDPGKVDVRVVHGASDAPTVDVRTGGAILVDNAAYTAITGYIPVDPALYTLVVTTADGAPVAAFEADLSGAAGGAVTVLASGFLSPADDQNGEAFGLLAVFPDGTSALLPGVPTTARLQVIHNAADPGAAEVDVYVNGGRLLDNLAFRTATPFIDVDGDVELEVVIAAPTSTDASDPLFTQTYTLPSGSTTQLIANGVLAPGDFQANPDAVDIAFDLLVGGNAQEAASDAAKVDVRVVHGATDAPTVDVRTGGAILVDDASYSAITGYIPVDPAVYTLDVTTAAGGAVASFEADLSGAAGGAVTVLASGFLSPADDQNGEAFGLLAVFPDGTAALLPAGAVSVDETPEAGSFVLGAPSPNPIAASAQVAFSLDAPGRATLALYDVLGRQVATLADGEFSAGRFDADLDVRGLAAGAYIVRLESASGVRTRTVTVLR